MPPNPWVALDINSSIPAELMMTDTWSVISSPFFWNVAVTALSSPFLQVNLMILGLLESGYERERESPSADVRDTTTNTTILSNIFIVAYFHETAVSDDNYWIASALVLVVQSLYTHTKPPDIPVIVMSLCNNCAHTHTSERNYQREQPTS